MAEPAPRGGGESTRDNQENSAKNTSRREADELIRKRDEADAKEEQKQRRQAEIDRIAEEQIDKGRGVIQRSDNKPIMPLFFSAMRKKKLEADKSRLETEIGAVQKELQKKRTEIIMRERYNLAEIRKAEKEARELKKEYDIYQEAVGSFEEGDLTPDETNDLDRYRSRAKEAAKLLENAEFMLSAAQRKQEDDEPELRTERNLLENEYNIRIEVKKQEQIRLKLGIIWLTKGRWPGKLDDETTLLEIGALKMQQEASEARAKAISARYSGRETSTTEDGDTFSDRTSTSTPPPHKKHQPEPTPTETPPPQPPTPEPSPHTPEPTPKKFVPSKEWQEIPDGIPVPPGGEFELNLKTGKRLGRWLNLPDSGPEPKTPEADITDDNLADLISEPVQKPEEASDITKEETLEPATDKETTEPPKTTELTEEEKANLPYKEGDVIKVYIVNDGWKDAKINKIYRSEDSGIDTELSYVDSGEVIGRYQYSLIHSWQKAWKEQGEKQQTAGAETEDTTAPSELTPGERSLQADIENAKSRVAGREKANKLASEQARINREWEQTYAEDETQRVATHNDTREQGENLLEKNANNQEWTREYEKDELRQFMEDFENNIVPTLPFKRGDVVWMPYGQENESGEWKQEWKQLRIGDFIPNFDPEVDDNIDNTIVVVVDMHGTKVGQTLLTNILKRQEDHSKEVKHENPEAKTTIEEAKKTSTEATIEDGTTSNISSSGGTPETQEEEMPTRIPTGDEMTEEMFAKRETERQTIEKQRADLEQDDNLPGRMKNYERLLDVVIKEDKDNIGQLYELSDYWRPDNQDYELWDQYPELRSYLKEKVKTAIAEFKLRRLM